MPLTRGSSGPTTSKSIDSVRTQSAMAEKSVADNVSKHLPKEVIPGFPGAIKSLSH